MIVIDPQCGVSALALAGLIEGILEVTGRVEKPENEWIRLSSDDTMKLACEKKGSGSLAGLMVEVRIEAYRDAGEALGIDETILLLRKQECDDRQSLNETIAFFEEMANLTDAAGEAPLFLTETVLAVWACFRKSSQLGGDLLSLPVGTGLGTTNTTSGVRPVPSTVFLEAAGKYRVPLKGIAGGGIPADEAGLLLLAKTARFVDRMPSLVPQSVVASKDREGTTMRAVIADVTSREDLWLLEAAIDDATGEEMSRALEALQAVSLETHIVQALGKKGRPLFLLRSLAGVEQLDEAMERFFTDTPTIGVRYWPVGRSRMERDIREGELVVDGYRLPARVKISRLRDLVKGKAEADDIDRHLAKRGESRVGRAGRED